MNLSNCARCKIPIDERICIIGEEGKGPGFCPTQSFSDLIPGVLKKYQDPQLKEIARMAAIQEAECYANRKPGPYIPQPAKCRVEETVEFARKLGCKKLGLAFCISLQEEAGMLSDVLEVHGFEVVSVCCSVGGVLKETVGIKDEEKIFIGQRETMCNPVMQADVLNNSGTELNIMLGLCVGHDSIFLKEAKALCTVLVAKDRVTGHNPLAAIYNLHSYYGKLLDTGFGRG